VCWGMQMHSCTSMSVQLNGETVYAELDSSGHELLWTDGDVWTFFGRVQPDSSAEAAPELPCVMMQPDEAGMPSMIPVMLPEEISMLSDVQCMPANGEKGRLAGIGKKRVGAHAALTVSGTTRHQSQPSSVSENGPRVPSRSGESPLQMVEAAFFRSVFCSRCLDLSLGHWLMRAESPPELYQAQIHCNA